MENRARNSCEKHGVGEFEKDLKSTMEHQNIADPKKQERARRQRSEELRPAMRHGEMAGKNEERKR